MMSALRILFGLLIGLCLLLAVIPLYSVPVPDGIGPHWSTVFDLPSDWYILPSGMFGGRWLSHASILLIRYTMLLLICGIVTICVFKRFRLHWLPLLFLGAVSGDLAFHRFYPRLADAMVSPLGFGFLVAFCVVSFALMFVIIFIETHEIQPSA
jgi:hypothetical protein